MKISNGEKLLISALAVSLVAHLVILLLIRPQIMASFSGTVRHRSRQSMVVRKAEAKPVPVRMAEVGDVQSLREAPEAESQAVMPTASLLEEKSSNFLTPPLPPEAMAAVPIAPVVEVAPPFSEKVKVADLPVVVSPLTEGTTVSVALPTAATSPLAPLEPGQTALATVEVPFFAMPEAPGEADLLQVTQVKDLRSKEAERSAEDFKPPAQVMNDIDEHVIAAEKAAVRDLLEVGSARELTRFVDVDATSAALGQWIYFKVTVKPLEDLKTVPKDLVILMDGSGSIANDRLRSCRTKAKEILRTCMNTGDRFNLVVFRDSFDYFSTRWVSCDQAGYARADRWMNNLAAFGRTDVFSTIASVLTLPRDPKRPLVALVVTDGDANTGVSRTEEILSRFTALNDGLISVYMYGVKEQANRPLIDVLTRGNRGESFIYEGDRHYAGRQIGELSERFRDPVLSDLRLVFRSADRAEVYPRRLRNLYRGAPIELVGRVPAGAREIGFSIKGLNGARAYEGFFKLNLAAAAFDGSVPSAWQREKTIDDKLR